jgi:outer membrane receptor protein involved in Fe transport
VSVEGQYLSSRETVAGSTVGAAAIVNLNWVQPLGRSFEIDGGLRNLFNAQYADPASDQLQQDSIPQNGRTARIGLRWKLWE